MRRVHVRGHENVLKRLLIQVERIQSGAADAPAVGCGHAAGSAGADLPGFAPHFVAVEASEGPVWLDSDRPDSKVPVNAPVASATGPLGLKSENLFAPQAARVVEKVPASQSVHDEIVAPPVPAEKVPATHLVHPAAPSLEKVPAGQSLHDASDGAASWSEKVPAAHSVHDVAPALEKVPAGQAVSVADVAPGEQKNPASQLEHTPAPWPEKVPAGQGTHVDTDVCPVRRELVPAGHSLHANTATSRWGIVETRSG